MDYTMPGFPALHHISVLAQTHVHRVGDHIQPSHSLSSPSPPALNPSQHQDLFQWFGSCNRWPKYWSFSISPSNEYSGLILFRTDWFELLSVKLVWSPWVSTGLSRVLSNTTGQKHQYSCLAFFTVQLSHPYMTTGKTIALTIWTFVGKVMCLLFNKLSRFVIPFLPRSKHYLISQLKSPSSDFGAQQNKICHCFHFFLIYLPWRKIISYQRGTW